MHVPPTNEQIAYLMSIGVENDIIGYPNAVTSVPPLKQAKAPSQDSNHSKKGLEFVWLILLILLLFFHYAHGEEVSTEASVPLEAFSIEKPGKQLEAGFDKRLLAIKAEIAILKNRLDQARIEDRQKNLQDRVRILEKGLATLPDRTKNQLEKEHQQGLDEIKSGQTEMQNLIETGMLRVDGQDRRLTDLTELVAQIKHTMDASITRMEADRSGNEVLLENVHTLNKGLDRQARRLQIVQYTIAAIVGFLVPLFILGRISVKKGNIKVENYDGSQSSEGAGADLVLNQNKDEVQTDTDGTPVTEESAGDSIDAERLQELPFDKSRPPIESIIAMVEAHGQILNQPISATSSWSLGLATHKGNVRLENQDCGICFLIAGHEVVILSDGCGGLLHGQKAAFLATSSAAASLVLAYGMSPRWYLPNVKDAATKAIVDASRRLAVEGAKLNLKDIASGLRTTLIVVVGNQEEIGYAYIGDGGGYVFHSPGEIKRFLEPQKADKHAPHILAASLGPVMEGEPVSGTIKRSAGDILIVGTDGVFDRVEETFPLDVLRGCIHYQGDLQQTADTILKELASFKDNAGYVCDDNLTLGIMGDGTAPRLSPGFWFEKNAAAD